MHLKTTFDQEFYDLWMYLQTKYPKKLFDLDGVGKQTDMTEFSKEFFTNKAATSDISVDDNSNVDDKSVIAYTKELPKAFFKLNSYFVLWKKLRQLYNRQKANDIVEKQLRGDIYINDFWGIGAGISYCFNYSTLDVAMMGLPMVNKPKSLPPKHLLSFKSQLEQFITIASNSIAGATGIADMLLTISIYVDKILQTQSDNNFKLASKEQCWKYIEESLISFIYTVGQPQRGHQSLTFDEKITIGDYTEQIGEFVERNLEDGKLDSNIYNKNLTTYTLNLKNGKMEQKRIKGVIKHKTENKIVKYNLANGQSIKATDNHSFFTRKGLDIVEVQRDHNPKNLLVPFNVVKEQTVNKLIVEDVGGRIKKDEIKLDENWMYLIGQYLGDGCIDGSTLGIYTCNEEESKNILLDWQDEFTTRIEPEKGNAFVSFGKNINNSIKKMFGVGSRGKKIPRHLFNNKNILHLIGGYIDSDGCMLNNKCILTSVNKDLIDDIQFILMSNGILCTVSKRTLKANQGFNKENTTIYNLRILIKYVQKINKYTRFKKFTEREVKNDFSAQYFDFEGIYEILRDEYDIYNPSYCFDIEARRGKKHKLKYKEIEKIVNTLEKNVYKIESNVVLDKSEKGKILCDINHQKNYRSKYTQEERLATFKELIFKLKRILMAAPMIVNSIEECKHEEFVYDISVEGNENFLTSTNIYAHNSTFSNVSVYDDEFLRELLPSYELYIDDKFYCAKLENVKRIQEMFLDAMNDEMKRTPLTFPVTTACFAISKDKKITDKKFIKMIAEKNKSFGFINMFIGDSSVVSGCCRLRSDLSNFESPNIGYQNSIGGSSSKIGSIGVCTINLPRLAFKHKDNKEAFFAELEELVYDAQSINHAKRKIVQKRFDNNHAPLYKFGFMDINKQYSTVGVNGLNEAVSEMGFDILEKDGQDFVIEIMKKINSINKKLDKKYESFHNVEQIPAESTGIKLVNKDIVMKYQNGKYDIYSNQFIPLTTKANLLDRIELQGKFDSHFSGGSIAHLNVETQIEDTSKIENLIEMCAEKGVVYFAINYIISECVNGHISINKNNICSECGKEIINQYTRIVGYLSPIKAWNKTRRELDFPNRQFYEKDTL